MKRREKHELDLDGKLLEILVMCDVLIHTFTNDLLSLLAILFDPILVLILLGHNLL